MASPNKQLGQAREASTNAVSVYSPPVDNTSKVKSIFVCNTSTEDANFTIYVDADGTTYDESTALFWQVSLDPGQTVTIGNLEIDMSLSTGNLAYKTSVASAITITLFGEEIPS